MLRVQNLQFKRGDEVIFEDLNFVIHPGQVVAVSGRNGVGKSTLFQLVMSRLLADTGDIEMPPGWELGFMEQETDITQRPALDFVIDGHAKLRQVEQALEKTEDPNKLAQLHSDYQDLGGYEATSVAGEILHGLGFSKPDFDKPYAEFSGGWRIRLSLAQALMTPCDLLLLDEPTNHLDLEAILWLENWLTRYEGTVLLIAHDRAFLDNCVDHTLHLASNSGRLYRGNYSSCERQRAEQLVLEQALQVKRDAAAAHIQKFVDRFRAKASKAKQVQSRIKALERMQTSATIQLESAYSVSFDNPDRVSNPLFSIRNLTLGYGDTVVLEKVSQTILPGARIGVLGANGAGKTTLLRSLVGELKPITGDLTQGQHASVGYFAQHQLETLNAESLPLKSMMEQRPAWTEQQCRDYLGGWGFVSKMTTRPISTLSGGEKARFVLATLAVEKPAVLVLDEPTNHLDLDMRDALVVALAEFEGAVIIVSHDRSLLEKSVDEFWVLENQGLQIYRGDLEDYTTAKKSTPSSQKNTQSLDPGTKKAMRQERAAQRQTLQAQKKALKKTEREMEKAATQLKAMEQQLADPEIYDSMTAAELDELFATSGKYRSRVENLEQRWLELTEALESEEGEDMGDVDNKEDSDQRTA